MAIPGPAGKLNVRQFVAKSLNLMCAKFTTPTVRLMHTCTCMSATSQFDHHINFIAPMHKRQTVPALDRYTKLFETVYRHKKLVTILMTSLMCADMHIPAC